MNAPASVGSCETCHRTFHYRIIHNGFNDSWYAYCDCCGRCGTLSADPSICVPIVYGPVPDGLLHLLPRCPCGGTFSNRASPRCPHCLSVLDPDHAADWIERNAAGAKTGWRWQHSWSGLYSIDTADAHGHDRGVSS